MRLDIRATIFALIIFVGNTILSSYENYNNPGMTTQQKHVASIEDLVFNLFATVFSAGMGMFIIALAKPIWLAGTVPHFIVAIAIVVVCYLFLKFINLIIKNIWEENQKERYNL